MKQKKVYLPQNNKFKLSSWNMTADITKITWNSKQNKTNVKIEFNQQRSSFYLMLDILPLAYNWNQVKPASLHACIMDKKWSHDPLASNLTDHQYLDTRGAFQKGVWALKSIRALKISRLHKSHIFQFMGKIFCVEFQRAPLKFHTKYPAHTLKDVDFIHRWNS